MQEYAIGIQEYDVRMQECAVTGMQEYAIIGMQEYAIIGMQEYAIIGMQEYAIIGMQEYACSVAMGSPESSNLLQRLLVEGMHRGEDQVRPITL
jgi:hypothetical protein